MEGLVEKIRRPWAVGLLLAGLLLGTPGINWSSSEHPLGHRGLHWAWADTTLAMLAGRQTVIPRATAQPVFREQFLNELVETVQETTHPDELITSNYDYIALMLSARTGRAVTNLRREDQIAPARLAVCIKDPAGQPSGNLQEAISRHSLSLVRETEIALVYQNPKAEGQKKIRPAVVPWWVGFGLIGLAFGAVVWDFRNA